MLTADADRLAILRSRLASLSWFMRCLQRNGPRARPITTTWLLRKILGRPGSNHSPCSDGVCTTGMSCLRRSPTRPAPGIAAATPEESQFTSEKLRPHPQPGRALGCVSVIIARGERYRNLRSSRTLALRVDAARDGRGTSAACPARRSIRRRFACSCVGPGVSADRHPKVRHAARLDRPGDP